MFVTTARQRVAGLLIALVGAVSAPFVTAGPAQAAGPMTVLTFNMCGNKCGTGTGVATALESSIRARSPQPSVVLLQEVCRNQFNHLTNDLTAYRGVFVATVAGACAAGVDYGIAILVRTTSYTNLGSWPLPKTSGEARRVMCIQSSAFGGTQPLVACNSHLTIVTADRPGQVNALASRAAVYNASNRVLIGGDFNAKPGAAELNALYNNAYVPAGHGSFAEADLSYRGNRFDSNNGQNEQTSCGGQKPGCGVNPLPLVTAKIDYVFLANGDWSGYSADATQSTKSDHKLLWASATKS